MATLTPVVKQQFLNAGVPVANGFLYTYAAGTTTPQAAYTDQSEATQLPNPVPLDANGMAEIWLGELSYKLVLEDSLNNVLWTADNISAISPGSVGTLQLANQSVTNLKLASGALSADSTGRAIMAAQYIQTAHIGVLQVTAATIANGTITPTQCQSGIGFVPTGGCIPYFGTTVPTGFLWCDGTSYLRTTYSALFAAIGTACGTADSTHFNVPDMRGRFMRGADATPGGTAAGNDPDAGARTAINTGGNTGISVGSLQADQYASHSHSYSDMALANAQTASSSYGLFNQFSTTTGSSGGTETRPKNVYCQWIIKT